MIAVHEEPTANGELVAPLHSRRRRRGLLAQKLQHVIAGAGLFFSGVQSGAAEKYHRRGHIWRPETLAAVATLTVGLLRGRLAAAGERRRSLRVTTDGLSIGGRLRFSRRFTARWSEIAGIDVTDREATVRTRGGRTRRLNLADLENAPAVREALMHARERLTP